MLFSDVGNKFMFLTFIIYLSYIHNCLFVHFSKSGRPPLKKQSDRKALTRVGQTPNSGSPDFTGAFKTSQICISCIWGVHFNNTMILNSSYTF